MGRAGSTAIPVLIVEGCPPPSPSPAEQGFKLCIFVPCQQRSDFLNYFFSISFKTTSAWWPPAQGSPVLSASSLRVRAIALLHPDRSFLKSLPCSPVFQVWQFPISQVCAWDGTQRDMNLFSALLKLQHCPQIFLTQRQCSSVHQPAHFALSKDTFPCMEWSPTVSHKSNGLAGEIESKAFQDNNPPETTWNKWGLGMHPDNDSWSHLLITGLGNNPFLLLLP